HVGRPFPHDLDTHAAGADVELLDPRRYTHDARMTKHQIRHPFGKRLEKRDVLLRHNNPDAVGDHIVGEHVPHIFYGMADPPHLDVDVEADVLPPPALSTTGARQV